MRNGNILCIDEICSELRNIKEKYKNLNRVVVIGAGFGGRMACDELEELGKEILFICDNDKNKHNEKYFYSKHTKKWIGVYSFDKLEGIDDDVLCLLTLRMGNDVFINQLNSLNINNYVNYFLYIRSFGWESIKKLYDNLQREDSKITLSTLLTVDIIGNISLYETIYKQEQYFAIPEVAYIDSNEVMCEVGAYVGDTIEAYIWKKSGIFKKIYAFEPSDREYVAMENRVNRLKAEWAIDDSRIELIKAGVSDEDSTVNATKDSITGLRMDNNGEEKIEIVKLDTYLKNENVSFFIADIEGEEMKMLEGMEEIIKRDKPKIAIAIYHKGGDIYHIPNKLLSIRNDYKFDIVHHYEGSSDTVLYAY